MKLQISYFLLLSIHLIFDEIVYFILYYYNILFIINSYLWEKRAKFKKTQLRATCENSDSIDFKGLGSKGEKMPSLLLEEEGGLRTDL